MWSNELYVFYFHVLQCQCCHLSELPPCEALNVEVELDKHGECIILKNILFCTISMRLNMVSTDLESREI